MASNPALVSVSIGRCPAAFPGEHILCSRDGISLDIDSVATPSGRWKAEGVLFLSNLRMVFVADRPDPVTGLESFDLPLVYILRDKFNQPIFGCNNLSGECWPAVEGGGPSGSLPPHKWSLYFKTGGVGTFLPIFYTFVTGARQERARQAGGGTGSSPAKPVDPTGTIGQAFVDPNDPTTVFLSQPITEDHRLPEAPKYAANYGADESYAPLV